MSDLVTDLSQRLPGLALRAGTATDQPTIYVERGDLVALCRVLHGDAALGFRLLAEVTAVDWLPREPRFEVVYHLASLGGPEGAAPARRLRVKVQLAGEDPRVPTVRDIWPAADWLEREVWDLYGIVFEGHPDLRRLLMPDDWDGHPLRKDYPVQISLAVKTDQPLQVSEQEFLANIAASRRSTGRPSGEG